ncbi:conserved hypothetical protein [Methylobacterium sp. 4-46]|uniref:hypothetical protein n=1 Tax=unclassified Methylobacterium TaxID=2615210 RepID=UPI000165C7A1|nr:MULTISPECIES: hypothetical protein [Methylobacterium]ACA17478.1 conserved hypothetical protein [Methylobacterium sp. 4-46]WFT83162.1 hypothetical protein QA634_15555 [Methylobacterium nodulans]
MRRSLLALGLLLLTGPALADWRYCLARGPQQVVYVSLPFTTVDAIDRVGAAFAHALDEERRVHDPVQCPRADGALALRAMRQAALRFNREEGQAVVELDWTPERGSRSAQASR